MAPELRPPSLYYNSFFHPNLCHVCKLGEQSKLKLCQCRMISYCSEQHRLLHREEHEDMCEVIQDTFKNRNLWNTRNLGLNEWINFKFYTMIFIKGIIQRIMRVYEDDMFLYAKSCFVCREQENLIYVCDICKSINMCPDHKDDHREHDCDNLRKYLDSNIFLANSEDIPLPQNYLPLEIKSNDMTSFIIENSRSNHNEQTEQLLRHRYADYLTQPLTILFGIKHTNLLHSCHAIIHVIYDFFNNRDSLRAWEIILHGLHPMKTLIIVIINPKYPGEIIDMTLCRYCNSQQKRLQINYISMWYNEYTNTLSYKQPNIIVMYNAVFSDSAVTVSILNDIKRAQCLFFLTSPTSSIAQDNVDTIRLKPMYYGINNFASTLASKLVKDGKVGFSNKYLIIYEKLPLSHEIEVSSSSLKEESCSQPMVKNC